MMEGHLLLSVCGMVVGLIFGLAGLYFLAKQKFLRDGVTGVEVEIPYFGRLKTNFPSIAALFVGALLVWLSINAYYEYEPNPTFAHETYLVQGNIKRADSTSHDGTTVGIIPGRYLTTTDSDGNFTLEVFAGERSYTGLAVYRTPSSSDFYLSGIIINNDKGAFNYVFRGQP